MIQTWNVTIPQLTGDEPRRAYLYIPNSWEEDPSLRYPVLYMFDGHNVFFDEDATYGKSWGMLDYMEETQTQLIIAAVECNHSPDHGRLSEYSPFTCQFPGVGHLVGRGRETMEWFVHAFKPEIDAQCPTLPDRRHTFIAGSSMGGLMSLYALLAYNDTFSRAAALSPSLWFATGQLRKFLREASITPGDILYMDYGEKELGSHTNMAHQFLSVGSLLLEKGLLLTCRIVPDGEHTEASWEKQIPFFMNTLLYRLDERDESEEADENPETE